MAAYHRKHDGRACTAVVEIAQDIGDQTRLDEDIQGLTPALPSKAMADDETVVDGNCGGQIILSMVQDEVAGTISGGIVFDAFCASLDDETELNVNGDGYDIRLHPDIEQRQ